LTETTVVQTVETHITSLGVDFYVEALLLLNYGARSSVLLFLKFKKEIPSA
jgi:hypothetical protein